MVSIDTKNIFKFKFSNYQERIAFLKQFIFALIVFLNDHFHEQKLLHTHTRFFMLYNWCINE